MIKREIQYFFTALMFFTRIPCPAWVDHSDEYLQRSRKYFPLMGWIVGGAAAGVFALAQWGWPPSVAVLLSMVASVWLTGAFHEDGFADVCDGFGGGWTPPQILAIMKDSRVGAYGAIGIGLLLGLKFLVLYELARLAPWTLVVAALVNAHAASRFVASTLVHSHAYVQDPDQSKAKPVASRRLSLGEMGYSFLFVALPMGAFYPHGWLLLALPTAYLAKVYLGNYFQRHLGGYTGDCLGATQQVSEVVYYLALLLAWKFS
ncbi:MAG: adenosylcobinamide-GDP ribazoletransferase [Bernardetiaceae bacterium]|jgi:adenosylcobinamide-GDP ribazoletransferase|nr:adenosylcobinamide-GDP ribazoletransferase [Bernardetiaceae bacterium]